MGIEEVVRFEGRVGYFESLAIAAKADLLVVLDAASDGVSVFLPSKLVDYLGLSKTILGITPQEGVTASLLKSLEMPIAAPNDPHQIAQRISELHASWKDGKLAFGAEQSKIAAVYAIEATTDLLEDTLLEDGPLIMPYKVLQIGNPQSPLNYGNGLAAQGKEVEIHWFSHLKGSQPDVIYHSFPQWIGSNFLLRALLEPIFLAQVIRRVDPDLIQVHYASKGLATLPIVSRKPLIVTTMGSDLVPSLGYRFPYRFWIDLMLREANVVTTRSGFMKQRLVAMGVPAEKIVVNSWGIDLEHFSRQPGQKQLKNKWGAPEGAFVFFDPRSSHPLYNKDIILKAFAQANEETKHKIHLLVAAMFATDEEMAALEALVRDLGIGDQVTFLGNVDYQKMPELYSLAECTVSVPSSDGMPQTIFEAWACGSFLIVGDLPQYDEFIEDGVTARRVPLRDVAALSEAMLWVLDAQDLRQRAIKLGRDRAAHFANRKVQRAGMRSLVHSLLGISEDSSE